MTGFRHRGVPYFSQWVSPGWVGRIVEGGADPCDDPRWGEAGFESEDEYRFWASKICGLACLESVLSYWDLEVPSRVELVRSALKWEAYRIVGPDKVEGLTYAPFAEWLASEFGFAAEVHPRLAIKDIPALVDEQSFFIASVSPEIRHPERPNERRGGHLVLVHGQDEHGLWFHNPSGVPPLQADAHLDLTTFGRFYAERGIRIRQGVLESHR